MKKESFRILKEINSLKSAILKLESTIKDEVSRISNIEKQRYKRQLDLDKNTLIRKEKQLELNQCEERIFYFSNLVTKGEEQIKALFSENEINALTKQIDNAKAELESFEDKGFEIIEESSVLDTSIEDSKTFLAGSLETIAEIEAEINLANNDLFIEIKGKRSRIEHLHAELPEPVVQKLLQLEAKNLAQSPLTHITDSNSCQMCGYSIHNALIKAVEVQSKFMGCPGCERIIIPQSSKYL